MFMFHFPQHGKTVSLETKQFCSDWNCWNMVLSQNDSSSLLITMRIIWILTDYNALPCILKRLSVHLILKKNHTNLQRTVHQSHWFSFEWRFDFSLSVFHSCANWEITVENVAFHLVYKYINNNNNYTINNISLGELSVWLGNQDVRRKQWKVCNQFQIVLSLAGVFMHKIIIY